MQCMSESIAARIIGDLPLGGGFLANGSSLGVLGQGVVRSIDDGVGQGLVRLPSGGSGGAGDIGVLTSGISDIVMLIC